MRIPLTQGRTAIIDDADWPLVSPYRWNAVKAKSGLWYARSTTLVLMHRVILGLSNGQIADHRDGDGLNNQRSNLRIATYQENAANRHRLKEIKASRFKGVVLVKSTNKWRGQIVVNGFTIHLGTFATQEEAARAYDKEARHFFGEFAATNFPLEATA